VAKENTMNSQRSVEFRSNWASFEETPSRNGN